jgi:endonuclease/exonuclease/phosphatase family metal-dependent hydrolase
MASYLGLDAKLLSRIVRLFVFWLLSGAALAQQTTGKPGLSTAGALAMSVSSSPDNLNKIYQGKFSSATNGARCLRLLSWNIERGLQRAGIEAAIEREKPDICILQEVDLNARRTGRQNVAEELGRMFQLNYVFGVEFQELGQQSQGAAAYHGQAVLSALPIRSARILRFVNQSNFWQPRWYLPNWGVFQRRLGGRMALVAEIEAAGATLVVYSVHLESREHETLRLSQTQEILADMKRYGSGMPLILAGDFNTTAHDSPVVKRIGEAEFRNVLGEAKTATNLKGASIDWIFVRGPIRFESAKVHHEIVASDHYPLSVSIHFFSGS